MSGPVFFFSRVEPQRSAEAHSQARSKQKARAPNMEAENEITGPEAEPEMGHGGLGVTGFLSGHD